MHLTSRLRQILGILLKEEAALPVKYLAEKAGISRRTAQRELESVHDALCGYEIQFMSKTGVGVWLEGSREEKERLLEEISSRDGYDAADRKERRKRLILEILKEKGIKKLFYYSSQFQVSETTISSDLEAAEEWLGRYGLYVKRRSGSGISIEGSEENYRRAIRAFIDENMDTQMIRDAYEEVETAGSAYENLKRCSIGSILNDSIMKRTKECILRVDNARILTLTETSYVGLIIHISIAVNRILMNEVIEAEENWLADSASDEDYRFAEEIAGEISKEFEIKIPEVEISYICLHIKGSKHEKIRLEDQGMMNLEHRQVQHLINEMIDAFDPRQAYLMKQDDEFIQGLLAHLQPTLVRLLHRMRIHNPVLSDIMENYSDIYQKCKKAAEVLERYTGQAVPPEEIGYLTVHFGTALSRLEERREEIRKVYAGVVCSSGIGISRLMSSKLEKIFRDRLKVTAYGKKDVTPFIAGKVDFFISSIPLDQVDKPVVYVNPLLNNEDVQNIWQMVHKYERMPGKEKAADVFSAKLEEINLIAAQINMVIKHMDFFKVDRRITFDELLIAAAEWGSPYSDRRELIREDLLGRERIATQVFAEFGFALLHTCTKGVTRPGFCICMTKNLGTFLDPYLKGIRYVFIMLVPIDGNLKINRDIMGYISSMLIEETEFLDTVSEGNLEEIQNVVSKNLKKYFNKCLSSI